METNYLVFAVFIWIVTVLMAYFNARRSQRIIWELMRVNELRDALHDKTLAVTQLQKHSDNLDLTIALLQGQYKINSLTSTYHPNGDLRGITVDGMELLVPEPAAMFYLDDYVKKTTTESIEKQTGKNAIIESINNVIKSDLINSKETAPMKTKTNHDGDGMRKYEESVKKSIVANKVKKTTKKEIKEVAKIATKRKSAKEKQK